MSKSKSTKIKVSVALALCCLGGVLGSEVIVLYFGGTENVPSWAYYTFMLIFLIPTAYIYAAFVDIFKNKE